MDHDYPEESEESEESEDPVTKAAREKAEIDFFRKEIKRTHNFTEDEIETLLDTDEKIRAFYHESRELSHLKDDSHLKQEDDEDDDDESEPALTPEDEKRAEELRGQKRKKTPVKPSKDIPV